MKKLKWIFIFQLTTFLGLNYASAQIQDTSCRKPSFSVWKEGALNQFDSLTYDTFNSGSHLATNFWVVRESIKIIIKPNKLDKYFCDILSNFSDSIDWNQSTVIFHMMARGETTRIYITIAFSDEDKTIGKLYDANYDLYKPINYYDFFDPEQQKNILNTAMFTSNSFVIVSKFNRNFEQTFSKVLIGPWYEDLEPLLRIYFSE